MAADEHFRQAEIEKFRSCYQRLIRFVLEDSEDFKSNANASLDQLNALDFSFRLVRDEEVNILLSHCCKLFNVKHEQLLIKFCQVINNLLARQQVRLNEASLDIVLSHLLASVKTCSSWMVGEILHSLGTVLYENGGNVTKFYEDLLGQHGILIQLIDLDDDHERAALKCMENLCMKTVDSQEQLAVEYINKCYVQFLSSLHKTRPPQTDPLVRSRIIMACMRGIQNVLTLSKEVHLKSLRELLAALKSYSMFGLTEQPLSMLPALYPTAMSQYDLGTPATLQAQEKMSKQIPKKSKKKRAGDNQKSQAKDRGDNVEEDDIVLKTTASVNKLCIDSHCEMQKVNTRDVYTLVPAWNVSSSESEYSDTEGSQVSRLRSVQSKIRHSTLLTLQNVFKITEKRITFAYISHFIPDTTNVANSSQSHTLFTVIMKDPTPKVRTGALVALSALIDGTRQYLVAADDTEHHKAAFTSFSTTLATMIKELHRCLLLALVAENSPLTLTQLIKCIGTVIPNVPYHKLKPGLLSRIVKQIKPFMNHRDPNIRVACLTCLGAMVSVHAPLLEVCHILNVSKPPSTTQTTEAKAVASDAVSTCHSNTVGLDSPQSSSGAATPNLVESTNSMPLNTEASWVIKLCVRNITSDSKLDQSLNASLTGRMGPYEPLPIKLESLQVLANLTKGYFPFVKSHLTLFTDVIMGCLEDTDPSVQLHGAKLLDVLGKTIIQQNQDYQGLPQPRVSVAEAESFWQLLLDGPLPTTLQNDTQPAVQAIACDCIANIGPQSFKQLDSSKQILCITLLLGLASDEDANVRAASVRALGVYVLYPCLRQDVAFVADTANAIISCIEDKILVVRVKAAWALGSLSDALVLNKDDSNETGDTFIEDFSDMLLLKLFSVATKASQDNDKVKCNAVRSLGNFLRYAHPRFLGKSSIQVAIDLAMKALTKNIRSGAMKVRWNACYAMGNVFKNNLLSIGSSSWTVGVFNALCSAVQECKNFKVRINAATALAAPKSRDLYGDSQQYVSVWLSLLKAADNAKQVSDFTEYKYRDHLTDQICIALVHCVQLIRVEDMTCLLPILQSHKDQVSKLVMRYSETDHRDVRAAQLQKCTTHLEQLRKLDKDQQSCLFLLLRILSSMGTEMEQTSGFRPTYD